MWKYQPAVQTKLGSGKLIKIVGDKALVEFDYSYIVELSINDIELRDVDIKNVLIERGEEDGSLEK